jgi:hypothetical protein
MNFKSAEVTRLQAAFGLAHKASEDLTIPAPHRKTFRAIAHLIWDACGEDKKIKPKDGASLLERPEVASIAQRAETPVQHETEKS